MVLHHQVNYVQYLLRPALNIIIHHGVVLWVTATHSHDSRPDAASDRYRNRSKNEEKVPSCSEEEIKQRPLTLIDKTEHLKAGKAYSSLLNGEGS